jgi:hypothetical protein
LSLWPIDLGPIDRTPHPCVFDALRLGSAPSVAGSAAHPPVKRNREAKLSIFLFIIFGKSKMFAFYAQIILGNCWHHLKDTDQIRASPDFAETII